MDEDDYLIIPLLKGFEWFDESLQLSLQQSGWPVLTRPESMVLMHVLLNMNRPPDIARSLRLTRQAVYSTIAGLVRRGIFEVEASDARSKIVQLSKQAEAMRHDARIIIMRVTRELEYRIGARQVEALRSAFTLDWGAPVVCRIRDSEADLVEPGMEEQAGAGSGLQPPGRRPSRTS